MEKQNNPQMDNWAKDAIKVLKEQGYLEKTNRPLFLIAFGIIIGGLILGGCILYAVNNDAFKSSNINNQSVICPQAPACNCPDLPKCPDCPVPIINCNNTCVLPQNFTIKFNSS